VVNGGLQSATAGGLSWNGAPTLGAAAGGAILNGADGGDGRDRDAEVDALLIPPVLGAAVLRTGDDRDNDEQPTPPSGPRRQPGPPNR
jgi:hypothetical protein